MYYRLPLSWDYGICFTYARLDGPIVTYFCVNYPSDCKQRLMDLNARPSIFYRAFLLDAMAVDMAMRGWGKILQSNRNRLLSYEKSIGNRRETEGSRGEIRELHGLSQEWHILLQDLSDSEETIKFLQESHARFVPIWELSESHMKSGYRHSAPSIAEVRGADQSLKFLLHRCQFLRRWTSNYKDRTNIQINLASGLLRQIRVRGIY